MPRLACLAALLTLGAALISAADAPAAPAAGAAKPTGPVLMLKLDDLTKVTPRWKKAAEFIASEGLKANFGIINSPLEQPDPELDAFVKKYSESGTIEFWSHGYDAKALHDKDHKGEFDGTGYDYQLHSLTRAQEISKARFGLEYEAFGPHYSGVDADTFKALEQCPGIKVVFFYGPKAPATTTKIIIERRMELEKPIFHPNPDEVKARFEATHTKYDYYAIQGHADQWDDARFADFQKAVRYLKDQGCRFMTVKEWLETRAKK